MEVVVLRVPSLVQSFLQPETRTPPRPRNIMYYIIDDTRGSQTFSFERYPSSWGFFAWVFSSLRLEETIIF